MGKVFRSLVVLLLTLAIGIAGCAKSAPAPGSGSRASGKPARTDLTVVVPTTLETLDPAKTVANLSGALLQHVFEGLTRVTPNGEVEPLLAERWEVTSDGKTWRYYLRRGVRFHDGTPFNAEAVKANLERVLNPDNTVPLRGNLGTFTKVNVIDEYTVELVTKDVFSGLPLALSHMVALMVSPRAIQEWGKSLGEHAVAGTGPFKIATFQLPENLVVEKNSGYWRTPPKLDRISFKVAPEAETRTAMLLSGEADLVVDVPSEHALRIQAAGKYEILSVPSIRLYLIHLPMGLTEMKDLRVRQALNYAVDKEQLVKTVFGSQAVVADSAVGPGVFGYKPIRAYPYDPNKVADLFAQSGWTKGPNGVLQKDGTPFSTITLYATRGRYPKDAQLVQAVSGYLRAAGIPVQIQVDEFATFWPTVRERSRKNNWMVQMSWGFPTLDGAAMLSQVYNPKHYYDFGGYSNPAVEEMIVRVSATTDSNQRRQLLETGFAQVYDDLPAIYLLAPTYIFAQRKGLKGLLLHPGEYHSTREAWWEPGE